MNKKTIPNFPDYEIDTRGNVYSKKRQIILKLYHNHSGYLQVILYRDGKIYCKRPSRLVLETFVGECPDRMESCHNNGVKTDNRLDNLRWDTHKSNIGELDRRGDKSSHHKLTGQDVLEIRRLWWDMMKEIKDIAKLYGVHYVTVNRIINRRTWKHI